MLKTDFFETAIPHSFYGLDQSNATIWESNNLRNPALTFDLIIRVTVNIAPKTAQRQVTAWLVSEVGNMLMGGQPQLVISNRQTVWQVPIILTSSTKGQVGQVGSVAVDTESGQLLLNQHLGEQILTNVKNLICATPTAT